ncbi:MAG: hypothetical protein ACOX2F_07270 [bacterium]
MDSLFIDVMKNAGIPGLIFLIFYIYHKSQTTIYENMAKNQNKIYDDIIKQNTERENRNFETLSDMIETMQLNIAMLSRIESKIENNTYCPIVRAQKEK